MKCLRCEQDLKSFTIDDVEPRFYCGLVETCFIGYGSIHDTEKIRVCICDKCLTYLKEKKII